MLGVCGDKAGLTSPLPEANRAQTPNARPKFTALEELGPLVQRDIQLVLSDREVTPDDSPLS